MARKNEISYTPGPWSYEGEEAEFVFSPEGHTVAEIRRYGSKLNQLANGRLIAAAPKMLEDLKYLVDYVTRELTVVHELPQNQIDYILEQPKQAIALAEKGEKSNG